MAFTLGFEFGKKLIGRECFIYTTDNSTHLSHNLCLQQTP